MDYEKTTDGGSAFPIQAQMCDSERQQLYSPTTPGMTLRDYFAAKAMQGFASGGNDLPELSSLCSIAYEWADAMLKAREQK